MAILRRARRPRGSLADSRQRPGEPPRARRAPHVADQHRAAAALDAGGVRLRVHHRRSALIARLEATFATLLRMQRYRGHFYNWYDTRTLEPLRARATSRPSTAATWPATWSRFARRCWRSANAPRSSTRRSSRASRISSASSRRSSRAACARRGGRRNTAGLREGARAPARRSSADRPATPATRGRRCWRRSATASPSSACCCTNSRSRCSASRARRPRRRCSPKPGTGWTRRPPPWRSGSQDLERPIPRGRARRARRAARRPRRRSRRGNRVRFPVRRGAPALLHRLQRHRRPARRVVLRHAGVGGAARELSGHRHRQDRPRSLVQARAIADAERRVARAPVVERVDVRVPDAAARDADLSGHAAARDLRRHRPAADPVRRAARRAVGHLGVRVPRAGSRRQLSIPRLRRARARPQARTRRRSGRSRRTRASSRRRWRRRRCSPTSSACAPPALEGQYGFYEAIDYTIDRLPKDHVRRRRRCPPTWRTTRA